MSRVCTRKAHVTHLKLWVLFLTERRRIAWTLNTIHDDDSETLSFFSTLWLRLCKVMRNFFCLYVSTNFINVFIIGDKSTWTLFPRFSPSGVSSEGSFSSMENLSNYVSLFWLRLSLHSLLEDVTEIIILSHSMSWVAVGLACKIRRKITFQPQLTLNFSHHTSPLRSFMGS